MLEIYYTFLTEHNSVLRKGFKIIISIKKTKVDVDI